MTHRGTPRCVFCRASGATEEHVFARWISRIVPGQGVFEHSGTQPERRVRRSKIMAVTNRAVCKTCNEGWMSDLETITRPLIEDAIQGRPMTLATATDRIAVAAWAFKTALMLDCCWQARNVPDPHYRYLYRRRHPPQNAYVSCAAYFPLEDDPTFRSAWGNRTVWEAKSSAPKHEGYRITFSVGHIVFQAFGHPGPEDLRPARTIHVNGREITDFLRVIWPISSDPLGWPPSHGFNAALIDELLV